MRPKKEQRRAHMNKTRDGPNLIYKSQMESTFTQHFMRKQIKNRNQETWNFDYLSQRKEQPEYH